MIRKTIIVVSVLLLSFGAQAVDHTVYQKEAKKHKNAPYAAKCNEYVNQIYTWYIAPSVYNGHSTRMQLLSSKFSGKLEALIVSESIKLRAGLPKQETADARSFLLYGRASTYGHSR